MIRRPLRRLVTPMRPGVFGFGCDPSKRVVFGGAGAGGLTPCIAAAVRGDFFTVARVAVRRALFTVATGIFARSRGYDTIASAGVSYSDKVRGTRGA